MAMAVESRQHLSLGGAPYDQMRYQTIPSFTDPWAAGNQSASPIYSQQQQQQQQQQQSHQQQLPPVSAALDGKLSSYHSQMTPMSSAPQGNLYAGTSYDHINSLNTTQGMLAQSRSYGDYSSPAPVQPSAFAPTSAPQYASSYPQSNYAPYGQEPSRPAYTQRAPQLGREDFHEAMDANRHMVPLNEDLTPRPMYGGHDNPRQGATDAYGFPTTHSPHSSISSASTAYSSYYPSSMSGSIAGSVDGSATDYSSAGEEMMAGRQLPRPILNGSLPPAASSMMSQFNSKVSASAQKKHKCKICDKRFTRPSSLQTHIYSHTGEKPFACEAEGCGRNFSVVSNLRRHQKVHRTGPASEHGSDDE